MDLDFFSGAVPSPNPYLIGENDGFANMFLDAKASALFLERVDLICDGRQKPVTLSANCDKKERNGGNLQLC